MGQYGTDQGQNRCQPVESGARRSGGQLGLELLIASTRLSLA